MSPRDKPIILAIESSCDDTGASVISGGNVMSNVTARQVVHEKYGGVVPELASRQHQVNIQPVVSRSLEIAGVGLPDIDAIAVTAGPGLMGSLLVGTSYAKGLALSLDVPIISVHHMQAHVLAHFIEKPVPPFPFLCLTVSGGHTQIVKVHAPLEMEIIGQTLDDAAGEAFDKTGKMMGLPYPSGPVIDREASKGQRIYTFPRPRIPGYDYSFSGLKTAIKYFLRDETAKDSSFIDKNVTHICRSVQDTIVDILLDKLISASENEGILHIAIAGGVAANSGLRRSVTETGEERGWEVFIPKFEYCTDNAAMIAMTAHFKYLAGEFDDLYVKPSARLQM